MVSHLGKRVYLKNRSEILKILNKISHSVFDGLRKSNETDEL